MKRMGEILIQLKKIQQADVKEQGDKGYIYV